MNPSAAGRPSRAGWQHPTKRKKTALRRMRQPSSNVERISERQVASGKEIKGLCEGLMARAFARELVA